MDEQTYTTRAPAQPNQSLQYGTECLLQLVSAGRPIGSREMARELKREHTHVNRLLGTLAYLGLAERTSDRKYIVGPGIHVLSAMSLRGSHLLTSALPRIRTLIEKTGMIVALGVLWRRQVCYLYHGGPEKSMEAAIVGSDLYPAERSSIGMIMLAQRTKEYVKSLYQEQEKDMGGEINVNALLQQLLEVRTQGYGLNDNTSLAVAIGSPPMAALAVATDMITKEEIPLLVKQLHETADGILVDMKNLQK
ncbi:MAG: transcriptional regulator [Phycisphaerae bacterium]|nr:transcriptional regulator [Phycisphaerae bacterium]